MCRALDVSTVNPTVVSKGRLLLGVVGGRARALEFEPELIRIAPEPLLTGFERADERMLRGAEVFGRVPTRRIIAAADVSAGLAHPKVDPGAASFQALHTAVATWGYIADLVQVRAIAWHGNSPPRGGSNDPAYFGRKSTSISLWTYRQ